MESTNVAVVRQALEAMSGPDAAAMLAVPHVDDYVMRLRPHWPGGGVYRGEQGIVQVYADFHDMFEEFRLEPREFQERDDVVFVTYSVLARGRGSGATVEMEYFQVWRLRDGRVASTTTYDDRAEALAAAGL